MEDTSSDPLASLVFFKLKLRLSMLFSSASRDAMSWMVFAPGSGAPVMGDRMMGPEEDDDTGGILGPGGGILAAIGGLDGTLVVISCIDNIPCCIFPCSVSIARRPSKDDNTNFII